MVQTWDQVTQNPEFQALPPDQKDVARYQYFNQVVAPQVPQEDVHNAWQQFAEYSRPSVTSDVTKSFGRGVIEGAENTPTFGADIGNAIAMGEKKAYEYYRDISGNPLTEKQEQAIEANQPFYGSQEIQDKLGIPRVTAQPSTGYGEVANLAGNFTGAGMVMNPSLARAAVTKVTQPAADSFAESSAANTAAKQAAKNAPFLQAKANNINYAEGLNANAENLKQTYNDIYDKASEISQGITRNEPGIQKNVTALLDNLKDDPAHQGMQGTSQAYRDLTAVKNSFDNEGNIPLDSVTLLQRRVNDLYSPDMSGDRKAIYDALNTQLKAATKRAMQDNPEWAAIQGSGNRLFANFKDTYVNDPKTDSIWSLEDKTNYERAKARNVDASGNPDPFSGADPKGSGISTETRDKLYNLPANVKSMAQYESMLRKLPPEMQDQFTQDVIAATKEGSPSLSGKIYAAYKAAKGNPYYTVKTAQNIYNAFAKGAGSEINPAVAEAAPHVNDAIDFYQNLANRAYDAFKNRPNNGALRLPAPTVPEQPSPTIYVGTPKLPAPPDVVVNKVGTAQAPATSSYTMPRGAADITPPGAGNPAPNGGTNAEYDAKQALADMAKGKFKRGGKVLTPAQIQMINKTTKKTRAGRVA